MHSVCIFVMKLQISTRESFRSQFPNPKQISIVRKPKPGQLQSVLHFSSVEDLIFTCDLGFGFRDLRFGAGQQFRRAHQKRLPDEPEPWASGSPPGKAPLLKLMLTYYFGKRMPGECAENEE